MVTVLIPTYNCGNYVADAVKSALGQTYPAVEVIVIDDGSTDNTRDVLAQFGSRITVIEQENQGVAAARNAGLAVARGKYLAVLDADDTWLPHRLARMIPVLESGTCELTLSNYYYTDMQRRRLRQAYPATFAAPPLKKQYRRLLWRAVSFQLAVAPTQLLRAYGGYDASLRGEGEDYDLWLRIVRDGHAWAFVPEPLADIMERSGSLSRKHSDRRARAIWAIFRKHQPQVGWPGVFCLYRYHLGTYRFGEVLVALQERNWAECARLSVYMLRSLEFLPIACYMAGRLLLRRTLRRLRGAA